MLHEPRRSKRQTRRVRRRSGRHTDDRLAVFHALPNQVELILAAKERFHEHGVEVFARGQPNRVAASWCLLRQAKRRMRSKYFDMALLVSGSTPEKASPDSTGHLFVLLFFLLFSFVLRTKLCLFLLFLLALIFLPLVAHICFSLLEPTFPKWRLHSATSPSFLVVLAPPRLNTTRISASGLPEDAV